MKKLKKKGKMPRKNYETIFSSEVIFVLINQKADDLFKNGINFKKYNNIL